MKKVLGNGVTIVTEHMEYLRSASIGVYVSGGSCAEAAAQAGMAHFAEHMAFKGTESRTSEQIAQEFDAMGGYVNAYTSKEVTCYYAQTLDTHIESCLDLLSDMVLHPRYDKAETETEKKVILEEISMCEDSPEDLVMSRLTEGVWADSPLGREILGYADTVKEIDNAALGEYALERYTGKNIYVAVSGKVDEQRFIDSCKKLFGSRIAGEINAPASNTAYHKAVALKNKDIEQNHICIGYKGLERDDERRYTMSIMSLLLGGGMSSRLWRKIREDKGLAYTVQSYSSLYKDAGLFCIYTALAPASQAECLTLIRTELDNIKQNGFSSEELVRGKEQLKAGIIMDLESTSSRMKLLAKNEIFKTGETDIDSIIKRIDTVTGEDIRELANSVLDHESVSISVVGAPEKESYYTGFFR